MTIEREEGLRATRALGTLPERARPEWWGEREGRSRDFLEGPNAVFRCRVRLFISVCSNQMWKLRRGASPDTSLLCITNLVAYSQVKCRGLGHAGLKEPSG